MLFAPISVSPFHVPCHFSCFGDAFPWTLPLWQPWWKMWEGWFSEQKEGCLLYWAPLEEEVFLVQKREEMAALFARFLHQMRQLPHLTHTSPVAIPTNSQGRQFYTLSTMLDSEQAY